MRIEILLLSNRTMGMKFMKCAFCRIFQSKLNVNNSLLLQIDIIFVKFTPTGHFAFVWMRSNII